MANPVHLALLKQGAAVWNQWRDEHPAIYPDLQEGDLRKLSLSNANLFGADLSGADLRDADLRTS